MGIICNFLNLLFPYRVCGNRLDNRTRSEFTKGGKMKFLEFVKFLTDRLKRKPKVYTSYEVLYEDEDRFVIGNHHKRNWTDFCSNITKKEKPFAFDLVQVESKPDEPWTLFLGHKTDCCVSPCRHVWSIKAKVPEWFGQWVEPTWDDQYTIESYLSDVGYDPSLETKRVKEWSDNVEMRDQGYTPSGQNLGTVPATGIDSVPDARREPQNLGETMREVNVIMDSRGNVRKARNVSTVPPNQYMAPDEEIIDSYIEDPHLQPGEYLDEDGMISGEAV